MKTKNIPNVNRLYPNGDIMKISSFYIPKGKGTSQGTIPGWNTLSTKYRSIRKQIEVALNNNASMVQLLINDNKGNICYPDYKIEELKFK